VSDFLPPLQKSTLTRKDLPKTASQDRSTDAQMTTQTKQMSCALAAHAEKDGYDRDSSHQTLALAKLTAPTGLDNERPPLEIVAVVDRSGSMMGAKLELMKQTLELLCSKAGLRAADKFGLCSFASHSACDLSVAPMDGAGLHRAVKAVKSLNAGGGTNLSAGLLMGIDMLMKAAGDGEGPATAKRVCLLFTDGHANNGITSTEQLVQATRGAMSGSPTAVFTFGFGADHNEDMLLALSRETSAQYYHISSAEAIPAAFADCLGGLTSIVAQNTSLVMQGINAAKVCKLLGDGYNSAMECGQISIALDDLYAEDEKDLLFELEIPAIKAGASDGEWMLVEMHRDAAEGAPTSAVLQAVVEMKVRYFSLITNRFEEVESQLVIARPDATSTAITNPLVDEQRNRLLVANALKDATTAADCGDLEGGKARLEAAVNTISTSVSASSAISVGLVEDIKRLAVDYDRVETYRQMGSKRSKGAMQSHTMQRSTHDSYSGEGSYRSAAAAKGRMQKAWGTI